MTLSFICKQISADVLELWKAARGNVHENQ